MSTRPALNTRPVAECAGVEFKVHADRGMGAHGPNLKLYAALGDVEQANIAVSCEEHPFSRILCTPSCKCAGVNR